MTTGDTADHPARYDVIGAGYAALRRPDPRIAAVVHDALGPVRTVVNVGAGTGNYEPVDRPVIPIEPSALMARQRDPSLAPAVLASAERIPLADASVDAALAVLTMHHWTDLAQGLRELRRITRRRVVTLTVAADVQATAFWLYRDYAPELAAADRRAFPTLDQLAEGLGGSTRVIVVPVPADCVDGMLLSFWSRPEAVLDPAARAATSGFARMPTSQQERIVRRVADDLDRGVWDNRYGHLRRVDELDVGLRLTVTDYDDT